MRYTIYSNSRQWLINLSFIICPLSFSLALTSCADSEDTTPSLADENVFVPAASDQSETAQLRREFYQQTGSYLLFTDTLLTVTSKALDGSVVEKTELLDIMGYSMVGFGSSTSYHYDYILRPDSQRLAAELVRQHLVRRLGKAQPFAYLLTKGISHYDGRGQRVADTKLIGLRAYAISVPTEAYDAPDTYFKTMVKDMVKAKVTSMSDAELASFLVYSHDYYLQDEDHFGLKTSYLPDEDVWPFGFFADIHGSYFPRQSYDVEDWVDAVLKYSREQFEAIYGSVQMMMLKYDAMRAIITEDLGYVLE